MTAVSHITRWPMSPFLAGRLSYLQKALTSFTYTEEKIESSERELHIFLRTKRMTRTMKVQVVVGQTY